MIGNNTKIIKQANQYLILQCILSFEPISIEDIVRRTHLSRPTVLNAVKELMNDGVIVKKGYSNSTGGRAAALITVNAKSHYAVGVDFEFPSVRIAIANLKGEVIVAEALEFSIDAHAEDIIAAINSAVERLIDQSGLERSLIAGIGMGLPGVVDVFANRSRSIERIHGWKDIDLQAVFGDRLELPVYVQNDVHLLGLVEQRLNLDEKGVNNYIYLGLRSGIGSVVFMDNSPFLGERGNAGFIGHTTVDVNGPLCICGNRGCLDAFAGELAIVRRYREELYQQGVAEEEIAGPCKLADVICKAKSGDELCAEILRDAGRYLGIAIANLVKTLEITAVAVGGCPSLRDSVLLRSARESAEEFLPAGLTKRLSLHVGKIVEEQYALGGCYLVFDNLFHKPQLSLEV